MNKDLKTQFKEQGYILVKNFFSQEEIDNLVTEIRATGEQQKEADILNQGNLKFHSLLFAQSKKLQAFISQPKVVDFLSQIIGPDFWVRWDQAVEKAPGAVTFPWHQDNGYNQVKDEHYQFWVSLTKMTTENGGLWVKPGSHKGLLRHDKIDNHMVYQGTVENPVFIAAEPGDAVLFSSFMLHSTTPNVTQESRWAYVVEYMSLYSFDPFSKPPYLVIARDGKPQLEYVNSYPGQHNIINHIKYVDVLRPLKEVAKPLKEVAVNWKRKGLSKGIS